MPYEIVESHKQCPSSRPVAVVKKGDPKPLGCHPSKPAARKQLAALYASENGSA
jgi:hypothetical protein